MSRAVLPLFLAACVSNSPKSGSSTSETGDDTGTAVAAPQTAEQLATYYATYGGAEAFPAHHAWAVETLLYAEDELAAGELASARARLDALFAELPLSTEGWLEGYGTAGTNVGYPVAYAGLRMLDQILRLEPVEVRGSIQLTAVVAPCARVSRPTLPDLAPEVVELDIDPRILADDARVLEQSTALLRRWVQALSGLEVTLVVHPLAECTEVSYTDDGSVIVSYPDASAMLAAADADVGASTQLWWVIAPSGVPGDGSGYGRHFITGGMSRDTIGRPLFLSDDAWFLRKPEHLGAGDYTDVERRVYQPQWFQHELMHHLFALWPALGLEETSHQWFDRGTWPSDFVGVYEPDYYIEALDKRILDAEPSITEALQIAPPADLGDLELALLAGRYLRLPVENDWHTVEVSVSDTDITWTNAAGVSWALEVRDGRLYSAPDSPYGEQEVGVELSGEQVAALWFNGEPSTRQ